MFKLPFISLCMGSGPADHETADPGIIPGQVRPLASRKKMNILCIDGGGMRGIMMLDTLEAIQAHLGGREVFEVFDMIIGVSAGALISLGVGLVRPRALLEKHSHFDISFCKRLFLDMKEYLFGCRRLLPIPSLFDRCKLETILSSDEVFGGLTFGDFPTSPQYNYPYVGVVAASISHVPPTPVLFSNHPYVYPYVDDPVDPTGASSGPTPANPAPGPSILSSAGHWHDHVTPNHVTHPSSFAPSSRTCSHHAHGKSPSAEAASGWFSRSDVPASHSTCDHCTRRSVGPPFYLRRGLSRPVPLWAAAAASSCVPLAFEPMLLDGMTVVDGGALVSNPTALAIDEAKRMWGDDSIGTVVSIGSGLFSTASPHVTALARDCSKGASFMERASMVSDSIQAIPEYLTLLMENVGASAQVHAAVEQSLPASVNYFRFNPRIIPVDAFSTSDSCISTIRRQNREYLASRPVAEMLKRAGVVLTQA